MFSVWQVTVLVFYSATRGVYSAERGEAGESAQVQVNTKRSGTWADSEVEKVLKSHISFAKTYGGQYSLGLGILH